jgi:hypothetical protein
MDRESGEGAARGLVSYENDPHLAPGAVDYVCMLSKDGDHSPKAGHIRAPGRVGDGGSDTRTLSVEYEEGTQQAWNPGTTFFEAAV